MSERTFLPIYVLGQKEEKELMETIRLKLDVDAERIKQAWVFDPEKKAPGIILDGFSAAERSVILEETKAQRSMDAYKRRSAALRERDQLNRQAKAFVKELSESRTQSATQDQTKVFVYIPNDQAYYRFVSIVKASKSKMANEDGKQCVITSLPEAFREFDLSIPEVKEKQRQDMEARRAAAADVGALVESARPGAIASPVKQFGDLFIATGSGIEMPTDNYQEGRPAEAIRKLMAGATNSQLDAAYGLTEKGIKEILRLEAERRANIMGISLKEYWEMPLKERDDTRVLSEKEFFRLMALQRGLAALKQEGSRRGIDFAAARQQRKDAQQLREQRAESVATRGADATPAPAVVRDTTGVAAVPVAAEKPARRTRATGAKAVNAAENEAPAASSSAFEQAADDLLAAVSASKRGRSR